MITSSGTIINGLIGLFFYILIARYLGPSQFGIFSVATTTIALLSSISNIGIDTGIVRFVGKYISSQKDKALRFLKLALRLKLYTSLAVLTLGWLIMPTVAVGILGKPELISPLRLSLAGVGTALLFSFVTSSVQAIQRFWVWSGLNIFSNLLRLGAALILFSLGIISVNTFLAIYIIFPLFGFFLGLLFLPKFWKIKKETEVLKEFFNYNKWVALFTLIAAFSSRLDTFISAKLLTLSDVGIYSVAVSLSSIIPSIIFALATVIAPKLASIRTDKEVYIYLKKLQLFVIGLAAMGIAVGIPISYHLIPVFYGKEYMASIAPLIILIVSQAIFLISVPVHTAVFYYFSYPKLFVYINLIYLLIVSILGYILIGKFGYIGAAWTMLIGNITNFIIPFVWVVKKFKHVY